MASPLRPSLPDRAVPGRDIGRLIRRAAIALLVVVSGVLAFREPRVASRGYQVGDVAREKVTAPFDFHIRKDDVQLARERDQAAREVPPVLALDPRVAADAQSRFAAFKENVLSIGAREIGPAERQILLRQLRVPLPPATYPALASPGRAERVLDASAGYLTELYAAGIVTDKRGTALAGRTNVDVRTAAGERVTPLDSLYDVRGVDAAARERAGRLFGDDPPGRAAFAAVVTTFARPNVLFDAVETEWRQNQARMAVVPDVGEVKKSERILDVGERVTPAALAKLRSLETLQGEMRGPTDLFYPSLARLTLLLLFVVAFGVYVRFEQPHTWRNDGVLLLCAILAAGTFGLAAVVTGVFHLPPYAVPIAWAPLILSILFDKRLALVYSLLLVVAVSAVAEYPPGFVPVAAVGCIVGVYSVRRLRHRRHFYMALVYIALAVALAIAALGFGQQQPVRTILRDVLAGIAGGALAAFLAMVFLPVVEAIFRVPSDITLLELSDLNRPLLRRLMMEAPGTYHHSLLVGSLAEAAAESIGANSLKARVCAYHHDIGKLTKPEYYTENEAGAVSRHAKLSPSMSALVIKSHVVEGLEIAKKEKLPPSVAAAIPEHHGTTIMAFFYAKALEVDPTTPDHDYRYPGPRPQSKETAIVMLADSIEGASRSLSNPTPARLRGLVNKIVDQRLHEGQLDECGLSLADVARIREAFLQVLTGIFHVRVPYPELPGRGRDADFAREGRRA
ncbi:MAG: HD family phosphohydrolase [Candidatus Eiseniibacteriota bacterium]